MPPHFVRGVRNAALAALIALGPLAGADTLGAQQRPARLYLGAGASVPYNEIENSRGTGLAVAGGVAFPIGARFDLGGTIALHRFPLDAEKTVREAGGSPDDPVSLDGGAVSTWFFLPTLRALLVPREAAVRPYARAGAGLAILSVDAATVRAGDLEFTLPDESDEWLGLEAALGPEVDLGRRIGAFAEGAFAIGIDVTGGSSEHMTPFRGGLLLRL